MIKNYFIAMAMFLGIAANAQSFYTHTVSYPETQNHLYQISLSDYSMTELFSCEPTNNAGQAPELVYTDIAIDDNSIYYVSSWGSIYRRNIADNDSCEFFDSTIRFINSLAVDTGNFLYAAGYENGEGYVYKYDIANNNMVLLGNLPYGLVPSGDLFFYKGHLLLTATKADNQTMSFLYEININAPEDSCEHMNFGNYQSYGAFAIGDASATKAYILTCANGEPTTTSLREIDIENKVIGPVLHTFNEVFLGAGVSYSNVSTNVVCGVLGLNENYTDAPFIRTNNPVHSNQKLEIYTNIDYESITSIRLFDITGKQVKNFNYKKSSDLNISDIASGNYVLEFNFVTGEKMTQKLIINQ
jgi:hypothetical protein